MVSPLRLLLVVGVALLIALQVVRNAVVAEYAELQPDRAAAVWDGHPAVEISQGMVEIARSARKGSQASETVLGRIFDAARKSPLSAEPFLVRGVQESVSGNEQQAVQAYRAAELRDGRSVPARYFLADHDLRTGDVAAGLREIAMLARMIPSSVTALSPYVATFAQDPRNRAQVEALFRSQPFIEDGTLSAMAADPRNSDVILQLATAPRAGTPPPAWPDRLLASLIKARSYAKAYQVWRMVAHPRGPAGALIYDADFQDANAPAPFNWTLTSSELGVAERQPGGRLHVVYDGTDNGPLASQLLLLKPGRYQPGMRISGELGKATSLSWTLNCENSGKQLLKIELASKVQAPFVVPSDCAAQRLQLMGSAPEVPQTSDVTISGLTLVEQRSGG